MKLSLTRALHSLLPLSTLVFSAPIELAGPSLTEETWSQSINERTGTWLVEHYSPYCSHCKAFAPKWKQLVDLFSQTAPRHHFNFAQVDCASNGDLCHSHSVKYYPSIFLYRDGEFVEEFVEKRSVEELSRYVERNWGEEEVVVEKEEEEDEGSTLKVRPRPMKGAEKVRLPKTVLHLADDEEDKSDETTTPTKNEDEEGGKVYEALLADASSKLADPFKDDQPTTTTTQTPPASTPSLDSSSSSPPKFLAQQPPSTFEKKRSSSSSSTDLESQRLLTHEFESRRGTPNGQVNLLSREDAERLKDSESEASFVKFFAPWCGHCKKLAPHWKTLAEELESQIHVYQVDCDASENKGICRNERVQSYPTLMFYNRGAVVEYHGKRDVESMKAFALKARDTTTIKPIANEYELKRAVDQDEVMVLMLHSKDSAAQEDVALAREAAKSQMGTTPFYASTSPDLFNLFSLPSTPTPAPTFLVFKSHSLVPTSLWTFPSKPLTRHRRIDQTRIWLRSSKLPIVAELNGESYGDLFPEDSNDMTPFVTIGFFSKKGLGENEYQRHVEKFKELAKGWNEEERGKKDRGERKVAFAWVDGDRWAPWARSSYDVKMGALDRPVLLVADPHDRVYWKNNLEGSPLDVDSKEVYELIRNGIYTGTAPSVSSDGFVGRVSKSLVRSFRSLFDLAMSHPFLFFFLLVSSWVGFAFILKRVFTGSSSSHHPYAPVSNGNGGYVKKD